MTSSSPRSQIFVFPMSGIVRSLDKFSQPRVHLVDELVDLFPDRIPLPAKLDVLLLQLLVLGKYVFEPAFQLLDAVSRGVLDGGHGVLVYHYGKQTALALWG